ncbi:DUF6351 family protein [Rhabdothermincola salaria]|uniref:DUF6351 family protein n=1 Tax=Rhabdothermincola salaria TaxID=2903142 RepID=UPI001E5850A5|nr:DUF6351 family protein [Rhabdothermincola salaria]MCD9622725.1 tannase/feruloyl esterase family alpha/beta hydrolase [Rhabdothermincola salaria]
MPIAHRRLTTPPARPLRALRGLVVVVALALVAAACTGGGDEADRPGPVAPSVDPDAPLRILSLSTPAAYVTNGNVLVGIDSPTGLSLDDVSVDVDGRDVTSAFTFSDDPHAAPDAPPRLVGVVQGLPLGESTITAALDDEAAELTVDVHPVDGPLISGPQLSPFVCTTEAAGLGPPEDDCWARSQVRWMYRTTSGTLRDLADPAVVPDDVAVLDGDRPFIVRLETAVLNRSITTFAMLDPHPGAPAGTTPGPTPVRAWDDSAWNGRLVYRFGGGCGATFGQGEESGAALATDLLADGYAVAASSLTTFATACNDVVAAETVMVAKEHFSEAYGLPRYTIGEGGSGGAIQQLLIAQNYPGLLDAVAPSIPFPDAMSIAGGVADCGLLGRWYGDAGTGLGGLGALLELALGGGTSADPSDAAGEGAGEGADLTDEQRLAISGFASPTTCAFWRATYLQNIDPSVGCAEALFDAGQEYDPDRNPRGVRCTLQDSNVNLLGTDRETGYALSPLDNTGVQYGLDALNEGVLSVDEFLDLNEGIGGYDVDGNWQPTRTRASDEVLERVYRDGRLTAGSATATGGALTHDGAGGLVDVPVLLIGVYNDPVGDIHDRQRLYAIRDRLALRDGTANPNLVMWSRPGITDLASLLGAALGHDNTTLEAVRLLDEWLTDADALAADSYGGVEAVPRAGDPWSGAWSLVPAAPDTDPPPTADSAEADDSGDADDARARPSAVASPDEMRAISVRAALLAEARPGDGADRCRLPDGAVLTGPEAYELDGPCNEAFPLHADPRQQAGAPLVGTTIACTLVPADAASDVYAVDFTPAQAERLAAIFPDGVCDWTVPGRGQQPLAGPWLTYE